MFTCLVSESVVDFKSFQTCVSGKLVKKGAKVEYINSVAGYAGYEATDEVAANADEAAANADEAAANADEATANANEAAANANEAAANAADHDE